MRPPSFAIDRFHVLTHRFVAIFLGLLLVTTMARADDKQILIEKGRAVIELCLTADYHKIFAQFNETMAKAAPESLLKAQLPKLIEAAKIGARKSEETSLATKGYVAVHQWGDRDLSISVNFDKDWKIAGLLLRPTGAIPPDPRAGYKTKSTFRLPFRDEWYVFWGGDTQAQNYHVVARDQRHAYDILKMKNGSTHSGDAKKNDSYFAFGQEVLAPAAGAVVIAEDGVADNVPGVMNPAQLYGNHILLDLGNSEYLVICHFKKGSLRVKKGQKVRTGDALGLCGNSGNSSEAHIHIHLQDKPEMGGAATGLPLPFSDYVSNGKVVKLGTPVRGETIKAMVQTSSGH